MRTFTRGAALCCLLPALLGRAAGADEAPLSVRLVPARATLRGARAAQRFVVLGTFADGLERDVTSRARLSLSDPPPASLEAAARVAARADGELDLRAEVGGRPAAARVRVEGSNAVPPFAFGRDVGRVLTQR